MPINTNASDAGINGLATIVADPLSLYVAPAVAVLTGTEHDARMPPAEDEKEMQRLWRSIDRAHVRWREALAAEQTLKLQLDLAVIKANEEWRRIIAASAATFGKPGRTHD